MNLLALRTSSRVKADEEATGFITDTMLNGFLNEGNRFLYNKIVAAYEDYFVIEGTAPNGGLIPVVNGTHKYALPSTMQKLVKVEWRASGDSNEDNWRKVDRLNISNDNRYADSFYPTREGYVGRFGYFNAGNYLYIRPTPKDAFDVRLWFIPKAIQLSADVDVPESPEEFHELIADFASMRILGKSGEGIYKELQDMFNLQLSTFLETVSHRNQEAQQMVITDFGESGY